MVLCPGALGTMRRKQYAEKDTDRPLTRINRKGRPFSTCTICHRTPCPSPEEHGRLRREREGIHPGHHVKVRLGSECEREDDANESRNQIAIPGHSAVSCPSPLDHCSHSHSPSLSPSRYQYPIAGHANIKARNSSRIPAHARRPSTRSRPIRELIHSQQQQPRPCPSSAPRSRRRHHRYPHPRRRRHPRPIPSPCRQHRWICHWIWSLSCHYP